MPRVRARLEEGVHDSRDGSPVCQALKPPCMPRPPGRTVDSIETRERGASSCTEYHGSELHGANNGETRVTRTCVG